MATPEHVPAITTTYPVAEHELVQWLRETALVDPAGMPLLVFHATDADFDRFEFTEDIGFHFGTRGIANSRLVHMASDEDCGLPEGANVRPAALRIQRALRLPDLHTWAPNACAGALHRAGVITDEERQQADYVDRETMRDWLAAKGYDAIVYANETEAGGDSFIVFDADQVYPAAHLLSICQQWPDNLALPTEPLRKKPMSTTPLPSLNENRKADRAAMTKAIQDLVAEYGFTHETTIEGTGRGERIRIDITTARGLCVAVDLEAKSGQPNVHVLPWHVRWPETETRLDAGFCVVGGDVNPYHRQKATAVAYGFGQLMTGLRRGFEMVKDGSAFEAPRQVQRNDASAGAGSPPAQVEDQEEVETERPRG